MLPIPILLLISIFQLLQLSSQVQPFPFFPLFDILPQSLTARSTMHSLSTLSTGLAVLAVISTQVAAEPIHLHHKDVADALPAEVHVKRQDPLESCSDALCALTRAEGVATPSPTPPPGNDGPTTTKAPAAEETDDGGDGVIMVVSVVQPSLCSESDLQFSTVKTAAETGRVQIRSETGWGETGSVWNISANTGVELKDFEVPCQGSACTGITGNTEVDGSIKKNDDGSWSMKVVEGMQPSVMLFGDATGGNGADGKYGLTFTSTPPCALPIFQNCTERDFNPSADQWDAYLTGDFLAQYMKDNNINSLEKLFSKVTTDFLPTTEAQALICNPDARESLPYSF